MIINKPAYEFYRLRHVLFTHRQKFSVSEKISAQVRCSGGHFAVVANSRTHMLQSLSHFFFQCLELILRNARAADRTKGLCAKVIVDRVR